jgi:xanthine dehydrogenase small subunit
LRGQKWTEATVEAAMEKYAEDYTPLTDMRATAGYRALVAKNLLLRFYTETTSGAASAQVSRYEAA